PISGADRGGGRAARAGPSPAHAERRRPRRPGIGAADALGDAVCAQSQRHQPSLVGRHQRGGHHARRPGFRRCRRRDPAGGVTAMAITLQEPMRQLFYAPYYAAQALGAWEQEGLDVNLVTARRPNMAADALFHGTVDACWGGPMRVNAAYDQRANCDLVCFGEAVTRDPFMLIGRTARPNFRLAVLTAV